MPKTPSFSVVMAYHNRLEQTLETLRRFNDLYAGKYDFEVIIVDDGSRADQDLTGHVTGDAGSTAFRFKIILVTLVREKKSWINPVVPYNVGLKLATKDVLFIQNPEIYHCDDLFGYYAEKCRPQVYYTFPVFSSPSFDHNNRLLEVAKGTTGNGKAIYAEFVSKIDYKEYDVDADFYRATNPDLAHLTGEEAEAHWLAHGIHEGRKCNRAGIFYRKNVIHEWRGWYNHREYNKRDLHFLTAISREAFESKIGGFDLAFKDGLWYDDDDLVHRITKVFHIETIDSDQFMGIHQYHTSGSDDQHLKPDFGYLVYKNRMIYEANKTATAADSFKPNDVLQQIHHFTYQTNMV